MKERDRLGRWRTPKAEQRFRAMENELWRDAFTEQPEILDVETTAGTTRVYRWPRTGEPVVLLHGMSGTSFMWSTFVEDLDAWDVYAVDTMGDAGRSVHRVPFRNADDLATWLHETLDALGLSSAHLVGNSYGAWLALNLARRSPSGARSISLLDPAGMAPLSYRSFVWALQVFAAAFLPARLRRRAAMRLRMPMLEDRRAVRMMFFGVRHHPFRLPIENLSDDDLRALTTPTLLLIGAKSEIYRPRSVLARATALITDLDAAFLPGVGHALPINPNADAGRRVDAFLHRVAGTRAAKAVTE